MVELQETRADDPRSQALLHAYFQMRGESFPTGQTYRPVLPDAAVFEPPAGVFLVAVDEGRDVGCGGVRRIASGAVGTRYEVKHLYIDPAGRGRGWGRAVLDELEARARGFGAAELVLDTHHTLAAAGGLYARSGFVPIEAYNDNPNATVWLGKSLT